MPGNSFDRERERERERECNSSNMYTYQDVKHDFVRTKSNPYLDMYTCYTCYEGYQNIQHFKFFFLSLYQISFLAGIAYLQFIKHHLIFQYQFPIYHVHEK